MGPIETYSALVQTYTGRDKVLRTAGYACILLTGAIKGKQGEKLATFAKQMSAARTILRLFDDLPMWTITRTWGKEEMDSWSRICSVLGNIAIQIYYPVEKVAWLADHAILSLDSKPWWDAGVACWAIYLIFYIINGEKDNDYRQKLKSLGASELGEYTTLIKNMADFVMAFNWLPLNGILWSGKLGPAKTAFFGTISSLIGLHQAVQRTKASMKSKEN